MLDQHSDAEARVQQIEPRFEIEVGIEFSSNVILSVSMGAAR
jgi:hypothetical protein